ncbi:trace amine-associated receptor 13c-like [Leuresthes tenuis]|uniref:trace amine-associated receptor 13c-like n=1 Tax=Leuresthes tenuis TaxID=355514 RepID=UPI003B50BCD9
MFLDGWKKLEYLEQTHACMGTTCKFHQERPKLGTEPGTLLLKENGNVTSLVGKELEFASLGVEPKSSRGLDSHTLELFMESGRCGDTHKPMAEHLGVEITPLREDLLVDASREKSPQAEEGGLYARLSWGSPEAADSCRTRGPNWRFKLQKREQKLQRAVRVQQLLHPVMMEETELCFPQLNTSCRRIQRPHFEVMLTYIILSSISVLTAVLNVLVIISISHFRKLHTPTNLLLLSLAVSDFFVGLFLFFQIVLIDGCWYLGDLMCTLYQYLAYIITSASIGTMVIISIDRYVAICYPMHYTSKITQKRMKICVCVCWICSLIFQSLILMDNLKQPGRYNSCFGECAFVINYIAGYADLTFSFIVPIAVIIVLYLRVFVVAVSQARAMRSHITATNLKHSVTAKKSELKAARTLGVVVVVFLLCMCPFYCVALSGQDSSLSASSATFVICLVYFNSCLNPIIYVFFYPWFRKAIQLIVTLQILKPDSCDINMM